MYIVFTSHLSVIIIIIFIFYFFEPFRYMFIWYFTVTEYMVKFINPGDIPP